MSELLLTSEWGRQVRSHRDRIEDLVRMVHEPVSDRGRCMATVGYPVWQLMGINGRELLERSRAHLIAVLARTSWSDPIV